MNKYTITIVDLKENTTRELEVSDEDVYSAHKNAYMQDISQCEDILKMYDSLGDEVFDLKRGFKG